MAKDEVVRLKKEQLEFEAERQLLLDFRSKPKTP
jgi:hypothetical protein